MLDPKEVNSKETCFIWEEVVTWWGEGGRGGEGVTQPSYVHKNAINLSTKLSVSGIFSSSE